MLNEKLTVNFKTTVKRNLTKLHATYSNLTTNKNDLKGTLMERLLINRDHPLLTKSKQSLP